MSFTYTDPDTDLGKLRFYIGDTTANAGVKPDGSNFSDEELTMVLTQTGAWVTAVPVALRLLANLFASAARATSIEGYSENFAGVVSDLRQQAVDWEARFPDENAFGDQDGAIGSFVEDGAVTGFFGTEQFGFTPPDRRIVKD